MRTEKMNISSIESYLNGIVDNRVSNNTFFTALPDASIIQSSDWQDMVLIDFPIGIKDLEAYGKGEVEIVLYARPLESGKKNVAVMAQLEANLDSIINNTSNPSYMLVKDDAHSMYDSDINWHCNVITYILTVF